MIEGTSPSNDGIVVLCQYCIVLYNYYRSSRRHSDSYNCCCNNLDVFDCNSNYWNNNNCHKVRMKFILLNFRIYL